MSAVEGMVVVLVLLVAIVVVAAIADSSREAEEARWAAKAEEKEVGACDVVTQFTKDVCGRIYRDLDPRRKGRMVRVLDVRWDARGWMCSVLARPSGVVSDIRWDRLEDPSRFEVIPAIEEV